MLNGLASRSDGRTALQVPIVPIPTGSANSLNLALQGPDDAFDIHLACLNIIKGIVTPIDLMSVLLLPSGRRRWSFCSLAFGLMYDLDIGTEPYRWMGDTRFVLGAIISAIHMRHYKTRIWMRVVESDKLEMVKHARERVREQEEAKAARLACRPDLTLDMSSAMQNMRVTNGRKSIESFSTAAPLHHTPRSSLSTARPFATPISPSNTTSPANSASSVPKKGPAGSHSSLPLIKKATAGSHSSLPLAKKAVEAPSTSTSSLPRKSSKPSSPLSSPLVPAANGEFNEDSVGPADTNGEDAVEPDAAAAQGYGDRVVEEPERLPNGQAPTDGAQEGAMPEHEILEPDSTWRMVETRGSGASKATRAGGLASKVAQDTSAMKGTWVDGESMSYL